jgi:pimeloyl-ACP methyl ester carboxylesterase
MTLQETEADMFLDWVELLQHTEQTSQGPRTARLRQAADWLTRNYGSPASAFAASFCREVHTYLLSPGSTRRFRAKLSVAQAISQHRPDVIIAHSLGSVVAYEALWAYPGLNVKLFITIGSPLAMPRIVLGRLQPAFARKGGARPPGVTRWANLADVGDIVAIPKGGVADLFDGVDCDVATAIGLWDFHSVRGYLQSDELRSLLGSPQIGHTSRL